MAGEFAAGLQGALTGAGAYGGVSIGAAAAGSVVAPWMAPLLIGGGLISGFLGQSADERARKRDPQYQMLQRRNKTEKVLAKTLARGFKATRPQSMAAAMQPRGGVSEVMNRG